MQPDRVANRERLLGAASRCLAELGAERTSISAVARASGVSRQTVHAYFGSRERLVRDALRFASQQAGERMVAVARRQPTAADFLVELCVLAVDEFTANPAISPLVGQLSEPSARERVLREQNLATVVAFLQPLLEYDPDLETRLSEIAETFLRFELSLLAFPSARTLTPEARRAYLRRTLLPAVGFADTGYASLRP